MRSHPPLLLLLAVLFAPPASAQTLPSSDECRSCHLGLSDERLVAPARSYEGDVHAEAGFGCLACHGGGAGQNPAAGFLAAPERREIPGLCGRCHSDAAFMRQFDPGLRVDQVTEYWTSVHGQRLRDFNDPLVATCIDCHPAHATRPPSDPSSNVFAANVVDTCSRCHADAARMAGYDIRTDQAEEYRSGVHGRLLFEDGDLTAPVCNDCHGNHGAAPPGFASVRNVCGECHSVMADYFGESGHEEFFAADDLPGCATCHAHHATEEVSEETLHERSGDVCVVCHAAPDTLGLEFARMAALLDSLAHAEEAGRLALEDAEARGMEVSQALFELADLGNARTRARSAIHAFRLDPVREEVAVGLAIARRAEERGGEALNEYQVRRIGLGIASGIIALLIAGLLLKIREAEDRMEELISEVETFYGQTLGSDVTWRPTPEQMRLAASALMLEVCHADGELTRPERLYMEKLARKRFDLQGAEAEQLITLAERERGRPGQLDRLAGMLAAELSLERKWVLLDELWQLVGVDGEASPAEVEFMERLAYLLGVTAADAAASRERGVSSVTPPDQQGEDT